MKHINQLIGLLLAGALLAGLFTGCAAPPAEKTTVKVGVSVYDQYDTFIGELAKKHLVELAREMEQDKQITITLMRESADGSQASQNNQVESFIEAGCDIICVNLVDRTDSTLIIDMAITADIPILFFNRELVEEDLARSRLLYYVGAVAMQSGNMQGDIVVEQYQKKPGAVDKNGDGVLQYAMLEGEAGHQDAVVRTESAVRTVLQAGIKLERLEDEIANWVRPEAESKMRRWLENHGNRIELVFANNDDMALGAIDALKKMNVPPEDWPLIVGIDGTPAGVQAVQAGEMTGTVYNDAKGQAQGLLTLIYALEFGGEMPPLDEGKYLRLPYQPVTADNVANFLP